MDLIIPEGAPRFLATAGWAGAAIEPLPGDASFRRYFRVRQGTATAMLMHAPPPREDPAPFLRAARWLDSQGLRAPVIHAEAPDEGFVLTEDFGDTRMREYVEASPGDETAVYAGAIDTLVRLHAVPPGPFPAYSLAEYLREARLFVDWFCPARGLSVDGPAWDAAWAEVMAPVVAAQAPGVSVLRDYHAENIMLLGATDRQGLLDFQDALVGHPAYDLVSLLQDARRDVAPALESAMFARYCAGAGIDPTDAFAADYARLGAQRNAKIVGIFVRLWRRDGKPRYLDLIPRVWALLERDLAHPALAPVAQWFDRNIPGEWRDGPNLAGGSFMA